MRKEEPEKRNSRKKVEGREQRGSKKRDKEEGWGGDRQVKEGCDGGGSGGVDAETQGFVCVRVLVRQSINHHRDVCSPY